MNNNHLTADDEISSIIYACIATADDIEKKQGNLDSYNPISFLINSLYDLEFPIYKHLEFVINKGGARNIIKDVSSYKKARGNDIKNVNDLKHLFKRYNCKNKEDIIKFITSIYKIRDCDKVAKDSAIKNALFAYKAYYKNNINIYDWPSDEELYTDFINSVLFKTLGKDNSYMDSTVNIGTDYGNTKNTLTAHSLKNYGCKMMIVADGYGEVESDGYAYRFCEYMNNWFWQSDPEDNFFETYLIKAIGVFNNIYLNNKYQLFSAAVVIISPDKTFISSFGNVDTFLIHKRKIKKIENLKRAVKTIPTKNIDNILISTKSISKNISNDDIKKIINSTNSNDIINAISYKIDDFSSNALAIYQKNTKNSIFKPKVKKKYKYYC